MKPKRLKLTEILDRKHLAGGLAGNHDRITLTGEISPTDTFLVLDFDGIEILTPSYFKKCLLPLWIEREVPLGVAGLGCVREDLSACLQLHSLATWNLDSTQPEVLGALDTSAAETVELCLKLACVTAASLSERLAEIRPTAWSNRLANLFEQRLLKRQPQGRRLQYCLPWHTKDEKTHGRRVSKEEK